MTTSSACQNQQDARINGIAKSDGSEGLTASAGLPRTLPDVCFELQARIDAFLCEKTEDDVLRKVQSQVRESMDVIRQALSRYGPDHLSLSYNGGKDCLVLLVLILACLPGWDASCPTPTPTPTPTPCGTGTPEPPRPSPAASAPAASSQTLHAIYIVSNDPFTEVEEFVATSAQQYHLDLKRYALPMRPALEAYLGDRPVVKAVFLGTRRTDPHGEFLTHFDPTDAGWPQFMRVHPVIDWHYVEIWAFIRHLQIPFCDLYNRGFTSLGGVTDTRPNPALAVSGDTSKFRPAYELRDDDEERLGRN
ncbi:hypothetical protein C8A05DRAFT_11754 [Staphylotrichum tortipilum]|uniref:FAD synthase n=1 Tax=Staphylotrichum tortipilum TaxID=2831512 RepID=A0AAN6MU47_9PEZI|nr:hypothetical protein C8A05DRAFT_11754 [Staphylotrichum longicolle]